MSAASRASAAAAVAAPADVVRRAVAESASTDPGEPARRPAAERISLLAALLLGLWHGIAGCCGAGRRGATIQRAFASAVRSRANARGGTGLRRRSHRRRLGNQPRGGDDRLASCRDGRGARQRVRGSSEHMRSCAIASGLRRPSGAGQRSRLRSQRVVHGGLPLLPALERSLQVLRELQAYSEAVKATLPLLAAVAAIRPQSPAADEAATDPP